MLIRHWFYSISTEKGSNQALKTEQYWHLDYWMEVRLAIQLKMLTPVWNNLPQPRRCHYVSCGQHIYFCLFINCCLPDTVTYCAVNRYLCLLVNRYFYLFVNCFLPTESGGRDFGPRLSVRVTLSPGRRDLPLSPNIRFVYKRKYQKECLIQFKYMYGGPFINYKNQYDKNITLMNKKSEIYAACLHKKYFRPFFLSTNDPILGKWVKLYKELKTFKKITIIFLSIKDILLGFIKVWKAIKYKKLDYIALFDSYNLIDSNCARRRKNIGIIMVLFITHTST